jgi:chromosome segregation ATPase
MIFTEVMRGVIGIVERNLDELYESNAIESFDRVSLDTIKWVVSAVELELGNRIGECADLHEALKEAREEQAQWNAKAATLAANLNQEKHAFKTFRDSQNGMMNELQNVTCERNRLRDEIHRASVAIAEHYPTLCGDQWKEQGVSLSALVDCMAAELKELKGGE